MTLFILYVCIYIYIYTYILSPWLSWTTNTHEFVMGGPSATAWSGIQYPESSIRNLVSGIRYPVKTSIRNPVSGTQYLEKRFWDIYIYIYIYINIKKNIYINMIYYLTSYIIFCIFCTFYIYCIFYLFTHILYILYILYIFYISYILYILYISLILYIYIINKCLFLLWYMYKRLFLPIPTNAHEFVSIPTRIRDGRHHRNEQIPARRLDKTVGRDA